MLFHLTRHKKPIDNVECFIYCIRASRTGSFVYIGVTSNLKARMSSHLSASYEKSKKERWIQSLLAEGNKPYFEVIKSIKGRINARKEEAKLIRLLKPPLNTAL